MDLDESCIYTTENAIVSVKTLYVADKHYVFEFISHGHDFGCI